MSKVDFITSYEQVDQAIFDKLQGCMINDSNDVPQPVPVHFYNPDLDLKDADYPLFVVYRQSEMPDDARRSIDDVRDNLRYIPIEVTGELQLDSVDKRDNPEPWNIIYAVRLFADYHTDMNSMKWFFRQQFPRFTYIEINNVKYDVSHFGFDLSGSGYKDFGLTEDGVKKLVEQYLLKVEVNFDFGTRKTVKVTKQIETKINHD